MLGLLSSLDGENTMAQTLAFTTRVAPTDCNSAHKPANSTDRTPKLVSSYSLIVVMLVYVLFGAAGFFAAAHVI
jgi:hypothetical protein